MNNPIKFVVVGCGKQSWVHLKCLIKLFDQYKIQVVGLVDHCHTQLELYRNQIKNMNIDLSTIYFTDSLKDLSKNIDLSEVIVDIVTNNNHHYEIAKSAIEFNVKGIIIEKPMAHNMETALDMLKINCPIYVIENYLFSTITQYVKDYITNNNLKINFIKSEFSKDRRLDSSKGRGFESEYIPHVFSIEIPHQLALVCYFAGFPKYISDAWCNDMILPDGRLPSHGEGAITMIHDKGVPSYNFSCLQGYRHLSLNYRTIRIFCEDDIRIFCYYPTTLDLDGSILIYKGDTIIGKKIFIDDSIKETFKYIIDCSINNTKHINDAAFGYKIMEIIEKSKSLTQHLR